MAAALAPSAAAIAAALIPGHSISLYPCRSAGGYWRCEATAPASGLRTDGTGRTPWDAIAEAARLTHRWHEWLHTDQPHDDSLPF